MNSNAMPKTALGASVSPQDHDRTFFVPPHRGANTFPCSPLFTRLLRFASRKPQRIVVRDVGLGVEKTHIQLLTDVLALRAAVEASLDHATLATLENRGEVHIGVLASGGYEYAVAVLAALALGAAVVPMSTALPVEEASYFVLKSRQVAIFASSGATGLCESLVQFVNQTAAADVRCISIAPHLTASPLSPDEILISSDQYLDDNAAGVVIFTSGTTGKPKGAVMRRGYTHDCALAVADHFQLTEKDVMLHVLPVHHATGIGITFFPFLISGGCVEFRSGSFDSAWTWERWRQGGLTFFSGVPTIYMRMMKYYGQNLSKLPKERLDQYMVGARKIQMLCGTSALPRPMQQFWTNIRRGNVIITRYGATEFGAVFMVPLEPGDTPETSVGEVVAGLDVKLSEGDEGEVLVRSPYMFSKYLFDDAATANAHDSEGYYKTGDIARREGKHYFILGRASFDIIKSGGYKLSALDIERECLGLPYVAEVMVVAVEDEEFGQRVGAVISVREDQDEYSSSAKEGKKQLTIDDLRRDLKGRLAGYKMPTLLRVVEGELPKTGTGKVSKKDLGPRYFPPDWRRIQEVQRWYNKRGDARVKL